MEGDENGGSQQPSCLDVDLRKILKEEPMLLDSSQLLMKALSSSSIQLLIKTVGITSVPQLMRVAEDICRIAVNEGTQSSEEKLLTEGIRNDLPKDRSLQLKFLGEVSNALTGEELKGIEDEGLKLALFDSNSIVACGDESSANVGILLLDDNGGDDEDEITHEKYVRRIIGVGEKKRPHFAKKAFISLKNGVGNLSGLKLGHDRHRIKKWRCKLGAKIAQNLGIMVQVAWTEPFMVVDKRDKQYEKHIPPILSSEVWRLEKIARKGEPRKCLERKNIKTLQDFLFWFNANAEELRQILPVGDGVWKSIVTHAETCKIDDIRLFSHKLDGVCVVYDAVGKLKEVINESHSVPFDNLSADKKDHARNLLRSLLEPSAFGDRYNVEASSLVQDGSSSQNFTNPNNLFDSKPASVPLPHPKITDDETPSPSIFDGPSSLLHLSTCGENEVNNSVEDFLRFNNHFSPTRLLSENDNVDANASSRFMMDENLWGPNYMITTCQISSAVADPPKRWKKISTLLLVIREWKSTDTGRTPKKRRLDDETPSSSTFDGLSSLLNLSICGENDNYVGGYDVEDFQCWDSHFTPTRLLSENDNVDANAFMMDGNLWGPNYMLTTTCEISCGVGVGVVADPPKRWKKFWMLWFVVWGWKSIDIGRTHKKRRLG